MLMRKELLKHSFWKSAEEFEKEGFNLPLFLEKNEKSAQASGFCRNSGTEVFLHGDFNAEGTESAEFAGKIEE